LISRARVDVCGQRAARTRLCAFVFLDDEDRIVYLPYGDPILSSTAGFCSWMDGWIGCDAYIRASLYSGEIRSFFGLAWCQLATRPLAHKSILSLATQDFRKQTGQGTFVHGFSTRADVGQPFGQLFLKKSINKINIV
jgi:hypothetical protein